MDFLNKICDVTNSNHMPFFLADFVLKKSLVDSILEKLCTDNDAMTCLIIIVGDMSHFGATSLEGHILKWSYVFQMAPFQARYSVLRKFLLIGTYQIC